MSLRLTWLVWDVPGLFEHEEEAIALSRMLRIGGKGWRIFPLFLFRLGLYVDTLLYGSQLYKSYRIAYTPKISDFALLSFHLCGR